MKTFASILILTSCALTAHAAIGMRVEPPSQRGHSTQAIRESGERGGLLLTIGTNFTPAANVEMGEAMELWNSHQWDKAVESLRQIWQQNPGSPWAAEAELHEACYSKFGCQYDEAEERFVSLLEKYKNEPAIKNKVLRYLPHLYAQTGRYQAALDCLMQMKELPLTWQERQYIENYGRIFARGLALDSRDRLCGTRALALAIAAQNPKGERLLNVSIEDVHKRFPWAKNKSPHQDGFSIQELSSLVNASALQIDQEMLGRCASPGHPVLAYLKAPAAPRVFSILSKPARQNERMPTGHFLVIEKISGSSVDLLDPDVGRVRLPLAHFLYRWSGIILKLQDQRDVNGRLIPAESAAAMRGGCCGNPPADPNNECPGDDVPGDAGSGGFWRGLPGTGSSGGPGSASMFRSDGMPAGGCPSCGSPGGGGGSGSCEECGAPIYSFGLSSANLKLKDTPMWYPSANGPQMNISLVYKRVATERMGYYTNVNYSLFGHKWHFYFSSFLTEQPSISDAEIMLPGGRVERYRKNQDGSYTNYDIWNQNSLVRTGQWFALTIKQSGNTWYFNPSTTSGQRLEKVADQYGYEVNLQYEDSSGRLTNMIDAVGRYYSFSYNPQGYVTNVADSLGRNAVFGYSQDGDLISMIDMGGLPTTIQYDTNHWPTNIIYPSGQNWNIKYTYGLGTIYSGYDEPFRMVVSDPLNQTNEYFYTGAGDIDRMPITIRDRIGNNWLYSFKEISGSPSQGGALRRYYSAANAYTKYEGNGEYCCYGDQMERLGYDEDGNALTVSQANHKYLAAIGWQCGPGYWIDDMRISNTYDTNRNLLSSTVLTNDGHYGLYIVGTWTNWYDARDNRIGTHNPLNQVTRYVFDDKDRLLYLTNALLQLTRMQYDPDGNLTNLVDSLNRTNRWVYDSNGHETAAISANGQSVTKGYDTIGRLRALTNLGSGLYLTYNYDNLDRVKDILFPDGTSNHYEFSCCGLDWMRDRAGRVTSYTHDALGRVSTVTDPAYHTVEFRYNAADQITNLITTVAGHQRIKKFEYTSTNGFSRLTKVTSPLGKTNWYDYTFRGQLATRKDGNGAVLRFTNDVQGRLVSVANSNGLEVSTMQYDVLGNIKNVSSTDPAGPDTSLVYSYDGLNRATQAVFTINSSPLSWSYRIDYSFDAGGNLTNRLITGLNGFSGTINTRYEYDIMNRLTNVFQATNGVGSAKAWYDYDSAGRLWKKTYRHGDVATYRYDMEGRLLSLGITNGVTPLAGYAYQWDVAGNLLSITNNGTNVTSYRYDAIGQLTNELSSSVTNIWLYDEAGNWLGSPATNRYRAYNDDNELVSASLRIPVTGYVEPGPRSNKWYHTTAECRGVSALVNPTNGTFVLPDVPIYGGFQYLVVTVTDISGNQSKRTNTLECYIPSESFAYDGNGNVTNWSNGTATWSYNWDWADRLTHVYSNGVLVLQNYYDAPGRRVGKWETGQNTCYLWDGWELVGVLDGSCRLIESYTRGVGLAGDIGTLVAVTHHQNSPVTPGTYYVHNNHRGDVVLTRSNTVSIGTYDYEAFGALKSQTGPDVCRFKSSSKESHRICGLNYYGYRFYSPEWQRWLNRDSLGEVGGINLYSYTVNDPLSSFDAWGLLRNPNWPPINPPPGGPRPTGPGLANWMGLLISAASALVDIDCQEKCPRSTCESCCSTVAATMTALNAAGFIASCAGSGGWFCLASGAVAILAQRNINNDLNSCMLECQRKKR